MAEQLLTYTLTQVQLQTIWDYLQRRPYSEVNKLAEIIMSIQPNEKPQLSVVQSDAQVETPKV